MNFTKDMLGVVWLASIVAVLRSTPAPAALTNMVFYPERAFDYTLLNAAAVYCDISSIAWGPNWAYFGFDGAVSVTNDHRYVDATTNIGGTTNRVRMQHECWPAAADQVVLSYRVSAPQDAPLTMIGLAMQGYKPLFAGGTALAISSLGPTNTASLPISVRGSLGTSVARLILRTAQGTNTIIDIDPPRPISMDSQLRIQLVSNQIFAATPQLTTLTITLPEPAQYFGVEAESWLRSETNNWFAYEVGPNGVPVDLRFLNQDGDGAFVPAGAHGFMSVSNGAFVFADGTPVRLWGLNCTAGAALAGTNRAAQLAARLARLGVNVVRLHHLDSWYNPIIDYSHPDGTTQHLYEPAMSNLDAMIYHLKQRGIYTVLDPWVQRCFKAADGVADYGNLGVRGNFNLHPWVYLDTRMQELIALTWSQVWNHVNVYTGVPYKNEPALVITEVINEGLMQRGANHVSREPWRTVFTNWYEVWARQHGFATNVGLKIITDNYGEGNLRFYVDVHRSFYSTMISNLHRIGVRIPINANNWSAWQWETLAQSGYDFMDSHHYYGGDQIGPGSGLGGLWVSHPPNLPGTPFGKMAMHAMPGAALTSSECGNNPPKTYRAAYALGLAAIASLQEWDGFTGYAYSQATSPGSTLSAYEWETDPASVASVAAGALLYRRGDVRPADSTVAFTYPGTDLWQLYWQNDGERHLPNTRGFNVNIEQHKVVVVLSNALPAGLAVATNFTDLEVFTYSHAGSEITSDTGELWRDWQRGLGTINTPRTQAAYGNLGNATQALVTANCSFSISTRYAVVALSSLTGAPLSNSYRWLLVAVARAENYGQAANRAMNRITQAGIAPVMCEPVEGVVQVRCAATAGTLYPVRVDGTRAAGVPLPVSNGVVTITLDAAHRTVFYELDLVPEPSVCVGVLACACGAVSRRAGGCRAQYLHPNRGQRL
jgi:hypothetical protein